ncbi:MAG: hypothetical protein AAFY56_05365 [Pseudomonadota bacterium]
MRTWILNVLLLAITGLVFVGIAEATLRLFPSFLSEEAHLRLHWREVAGADAPFEHTVADPEIGFLYKPNDTGTISRGDFSFVYHTDKQGFRNPESEEKSTDVVIVGDSMAFGYGVADDETWISRLRKQNPDLRIHNLGMIGAAPQQYVRILKRYGMSLHPKLVILVLFPGNDMEDATRFQDWLDSGQTLPYLEWRSESRSDQDILKQYLNSSYLAVFLRSAIRSLGSELSNRTLTLDGGARVELAPTVYDRQARLAHSKSQPFELVMQSLRRARGLVEASNSELLVVLMPTKEEVYLPTIDEPAPELTTPFRDTLETEGFSVLDLTQPLIDAAKKHGAPLFFPIDGHPNVHGYGVIASIVQPMLEPTD